MCGLREMGYPSLPAPPTPPDDPPAVIVERQKKLRGALTEIHAFRPCQTATVAPDALRVADDELDDWIAAAPAERKGLPREVARSLCYLGTFRGAA